MEVGAVFPQNDVGPDPGEVAAWARTVEELRFHYVDVFDHVLGADRSTRPDWSGPYGHEHEFHEPFVLYGFLAGQVRLGLATGVLVLPQRSTALVAKQAAEVDILSRGRLRLGVGIGWNPVEYEALGAGFRDRAARYEEQITLLRRLWTEPVVTAGGAYHRVDRAGLAPLPVQRPIPIWLGGGATRPVLERVGRLGDGWIAHQPDPGDRFGDALAVVREAALRAGRDPDRLGVQGRIDIHGAFDADRFRRARDAWRAAGVTHLSVHARGQGRGAAPSLDALARAAALLAPDLRPPTPTEPS